MKLNLGCGTNIKEGYINVDKRWGIGATVIANLDEPLPFKNEEIEEILCEHTIEHLEKPIPFIEECWRILKQNGKLTITAPHYSRTDSNGELDHKRTGLSLYSLAFCTGQNKKREYYSKARFRILNIELKTGNPILNFIANGFPIQYERYLSKWLEIKEITFELKKE